MRKFNVVYADPPWPYNNKTIRGGAANHYPTMPVDDICDLPVHDICLPDCALFLWATQPNIKAAFDVMGAWGFDFRTFAFTWLKTKRGFDAKKQIVAGDIEKQLFMGTGFWTRANPEVCLLGIKGRPKRADLGVRQVVVAPLAEHSEKPAEIRTRIERLFGDVPRVELFARHRVDNWDCWGHTYSSIPDFSGTL